MVSAWSVANRLVLGQVKVDEKSNEITAIPKLLKVLYLKGCIVALDPIGCQREIVSQMLKKFWVQHNTFFIWVSRIRCVCPA